MNESIFAALERAEKEIARLHDENAVLKRELAFQEEAYVKPARLRNLERKQPDEHVRDAVRALGQAEAPGWPERRLRRVEVHDPGNYLRRIERIWAFLSLDEGGEGVIAGPLGPLGVAPYIAADEARLAQLRPLAREIGRRVQKVVLLAKFTTREDIERIEP